MTKRFTVPVKYRFSHSKIQLNGEPLTNDELVRILNTNDGSFVENFSLKQENEQLKTIINQLRTDNTKQKKKLNTAMKENEQLKSQLRIYRRIASCSNCDYHDYDEFENSDGSYDEFEVCRKGNDVTERICENWKEL